MNFHRRVSVVDREGNRKWLTIEKREGMHLQIRRCCGTCRHWKREEGELENGWCTKIKILSTISAYPCQIKTKWDYHMTAEQLAQEKDS